jgi:two-component system, NarL family, invasion response regulator UvrY
MKILICDDQLVIREGVRRILEKSSDDFQLDEAVTGKQTKDLLNQNKYQLLILDISLTDEDGISLLKDIKVIYPDLPVLMMSIHTEKSMVTRSMKNGASGYLPKSFVYEELLSAIHTINKGGKYIAQSLNDHIIDEISQTPAEFPHLVLSDIELEVAQKYVSGKTTVQIADEMNRSQSTIRTHKAKILSKMSMKTLDELHHYFMLHKLL